MKFGSVCSGIEAASVAWHPLGWKAAWLAEIEPFPCSVLAHHYPDVPNLGDMAAIARRVLTGEVDAPDVLTGGTPCQAFSVAGLRESLADSRGNLTLKFVELADAIDHIRGRRGDAPSIIVWENVPGVLSTKDNAFGCFLAGLAGEDDALEPPGGRWSDGGCVYGPQRAVAWRTLDAQYFGLAQRRRRVFVVASARNGFDPATVLFEWDGVRRDSAPSRQAREGTAAGVEFGPSGGGFTDLNPTLDARAKDGPVRSQLAGAVLQVAHSLRGEGFDASEDGTGRGTPLVPVALAATDYESGAFGEVDQAAPLTTSADRTRAAPILAFSAKDHGGDAQEDLAPTLRAGGHANSHANAGVMPAVMQPYTLAIRGRGDGHNLEARQDGTANALLTPNGGRGGIGVGAVATAMQVRRLTPRECERLQGFPDDYSLIPHRGKPAADGPRYKALGNSWAVPVARWVGQRIQQALEAA